MSDITIPFVNNSYSGIANVWFPDNERSRSTAIAGQANVLGSLVGILVSGAFAINVNSDDPADCMKRLKKMTYFLNGVSSFFCILYIVLAREKPKEPPSMLAKETLVKHEKTQSVLESRTKLGQKATW